MKLKKITKMFSGEVFFALFLVAGYFKADHRLMFIQSYFDLTILFLFLSFFSFIKRLLKAGFSYKMPESFIVLSALFFGLLSMILFGLTYTPSKIQAFDKALRFTFITGWAFFGAIFIIRDSNSLRLFLSTLITVAVFMAIDAAFSSYSLTVRNFITGFGSNYIALARISGIALLSIMSLTLIDQRGKPATAMLLIVSVLLFWSMMAAGARGPVVAFFISVLFLLFCSVWAMPEIRIERFGVKLAAAIIIMSVLIFIFFNKIGIRVIWDRFTTLMYEQGGGESALQRWEHYHHAVESIKTFPLIGQGTGSFGLSYHGEDIRAYPHNILLELGSENGIIGIGLFLIIAGYAFGIKMVKLLTATGVERIFTRALLVLGFFMLFNSMFSGDINDNRMLFTFIALNGVKLSLSEERKEKHIEEEG